MPYDGFEAKGFWVSTLALILALLFIIQHNFAAVEEKRAETVSRCERAALHKFNDHGTWDERQGCCTILVNLQVGSYASGYETRDSNICIDQWPPPRL